jgi:hypothetical protein
MNSIEFLLILVYVDRLRYLTDLKIFNDCMLWSDHGTVLIVVKVYEGAVWILCMIKTQANENK